MFCRPIILYLLNFITDTIQVTEGRKSFPRGPHVGQPLGYGPGERGSEN
jgi:hypothetical protein